MDLPAGSSPPPDGIPPRDTAHDVSPINTSTPLKKSPWTKGFADQNASVDVSYVNGVARATIPSVVLTDSQPLWKDCLVGFFLDSPPNIGIIHSTVNRIWRTKSQKAFIEVQHLNPTTVIFRFPYSKSREWVLEKHVWHIGTIPLVVQQWSPTTAKATPNMTKIPVWVDFLNVPDYLYAEKGFKFLGDIVGKYQKIHPRTEKCLSMDVARVLITVNFETELTNSVVLQGDHGEVTIGVSYPWIPLKCSLCNKWGHGDSHCPSAKEKLQEKTTETDANKDKPMVQGASTSSPLPTLTDKSPQQDHGSAETNNDSEEGWIRAGGRKSPRKSISPMRQNSMEIVSVTNGFRALQNLNSEEEEGEIPVEEDGRVTEVDEEDGTEEDEQQKPDQNTGSSGNRGLPSDNIQVTNTGDTATRINLQTTRGRGRGRGRPRKQGVTHQDISTTTNTKSNKASFGKHK